MKKFLAIDTSSNYLTVIAKGEKTAVTYLSDCTMNHSVKLLENVEKTLEEGGMSLSDCDFYACVTGAGSFTGIRIGIATVKGFCTGQEKLAMPVTSFEAIAYSTKEVKTLAVISAGHGYDYVCGFDEARNVILSPSYRSEEEVRALAKEYDVLAGFEDLPFENAIKVDMAEGLMQAVEAKCAYEKNIVPCETLEALYVRKSQAEENRK